jgi:hypothetical protein
MLNIPPIGKREFYKRFHNSNPSTLSIFRRRYQCRTACSDEALRLLPKKLSELDETSDTREAFWGIRACERVSALGVLCYNLVCISPSLAFFFASSLKMTSSFDLQDPSVPLQITVALLTMFWGIFLSNLRVGGDHD